MANDGARKVTMEGEPMANDAGTGGQAGGHLPGPWTYRPEPHDDWGVVRAGRYWVAQVKDSRFLDDDYLAQCRKEGRDPWEANARLVAAAPDLLAIAERILERGYVCACIDEERDDHDALAAAIAKAKPTPA